MSFTDATRLMLVIALEVCASMFAFAGLGLVHIAEGCGKLSVFFDPRPHKRR